MLLLVLVSALIVSALAGRTHPLHQDTFGGRIVNGEDGKIEDHPYQLSFEADGGHQCGAVLIKPDVALTAAHCTAGLSVESLTLRGGSEIRQSGGQLVGIAKVCDHSKYNPANSWDYDFSVLKLKEPLTLSSGVQTIELQPEGEEVETGDVGTVSGWGKLDFTATSLPLHLQTVDVPKFDDLKCAEAYEDFNITSRMTCYGFNEGGKGPCQADSGGPIVVNGKLTGIVSWSIRCADPKYPAVFCKISNPEITDHVKQCLKEFSSM